jgi:hypothetical protein
MKPLPLFLLAGFCVGCWVLVIWHFDWFLAVLGAEVAVTTALDYHTKRRAKQDWPRARKVVN